MEKGNSEKKINLRDRIFVIISFLFVYAGVLQWRYLESNTLFCVNNVLLGFICALFVFIVYGFIVKRYKIQIPLALSGIIFSAFNLAGQIMHYREGGLIYLISGSPIRYLYFVGAIGTAVAFYYGGICLYAYWDHLKWNFNLSEKVNNIINLRFSKIFNFLDFGQRKDMLISMALIFIGWLPWLVVFYPGSINYDMHRQLGEFYNIQTLSNHHPVVSTLIMGTFVKWGGVGIWKLLFWGLFVYTFSKYMLCIGICVCYKSYEKNRMWEIDLCGFTIVVCVLSIMGRNCAVW